MGSIAKLKRVNKTTGKTVTVYRAYIRRKGFPSASKVCDTNKDAKEWLRVNESPEALRRPSGGASLADLIEDFVNAPATKGTRYWAESHLEFWKAQIGGLPVREISRGDINRAKAKLQNKAALRSMPGGAKLTETRIKPATVNRYLASLSSVFNYALDREIIDAHPMKGGKVSKLEEGEGRRRILTVDEEQALLDAARRSRWPMLPLFVRMCLTTAARKGEVLKLRWSDVQLNDSIAVLGKTKNGRPRALPLVSDVRVSLEEARKVRPLHSDWVFSGLRTRQS